MITRTALTLILGASLMFAAGCSDDNPASSIGNGQENTTTTVWNAVGYWETTLNATDAESFAYYSFADRDTVDITDEQAQSDISWDIAFERSAGILNGGVSGPADAMGVDLALLGHPDSVDFLAFNDPASIQESDWMSDSYDLLIDDWYSYNPQNHMLDLTHYVYIMKDAEGNYVKFQVVSMENNGMPPNMGIISIKYIFAGQSPQFNGAPGTISFDGTAGGPIYVDFSAGITNSPDDPMNSSEWDIMFGAYEVHQNNTVFGSGTAASYAVWADQMDPTDFDETMVAPTEPQAYFPDQMGSVMTDWYNYDGQTHTLTSKNHVYVIKNGTDHYKLQIITYYRDIDGTPVSGWYTFRWLQM